jgi:amidophosphoribosyltransferase
MGRQLARESAVPADVVVPVPDSGVTAALGYAEEAGLPIPTGPYPQPLRRPHLH